MSSVSDIKLIRTDTTLDLSQKAEKRYSDSAVLYLIMSYKIFPCVLLQKFLTCKHFKGGSCTIEPLNNDACGSGNISDINNAAVFQKPWLDDLRHKA